MKGECLLNYGNDPADQIMKFALEGTELALKLSGTAAKHFALFVYAVLKDQKKTRGKTRLVRMLKEQRQFKFFKISSTRMKEFAKEAKGHGLLYVPIRNKKNKRYIEIAVFADDASKVQRIYDNLGLDFVKAQVGEATVEKAPQKEQETPTAPAPGKTEKVEMENGTVEFEVGGFEDDFIIPSFSKDDTENFSFGQEQDTGDSATEKSLSGNSLPNKSSSPEKDRKEPEQKPSVKKQLQKIKQEWAEKKAAKAKQQERQNTTPGRSSKKKKKKAKGR